MNSYKEFIIEQKLIEFQSIVQVNRGNPDHNIFNSGKTPTVGFIT